MHDNGEDDEETLETPTKTEPGTRKRKIGVKKPKIEFEGDEEGDDDNGDAIDFSLGYSGNADVKMEDGSEVVDLTDEIEEKNKGKGKEKVMEMGGGSAATKVKKEVVDVEDVYEDEDEDGEMVV